METNARANIRPTAAVNAAFVRADGRVLLTRRSPRVRSPGFWCLPGGHVELGEHWWDAMAREAAEEVGLTVVSGRLVGIYADPAVTIAAAEKGAVRKQFIAAVFRVDDFRGEVTANEEVDAFDWFRPNDLPEPMLLSHPPRVHDVFAEKTTVFVR